MSEQDTSTELDSSVEDGVVEPISDAPEPQFDTEGNVIEDSQKEVVDYDDMDEDTLRDALVKGNAEVASLKAEVEKESKSKRDTQSYYDKRYNEQENKVSKLEGMMQTLVSGKHDSTDDSTTGKSDNESLIKEWKEAAEEDPSKLVDLILSVANNQDNSVDGRINGALEALKSEITDLQPEYRENKPMIDLLVEKIPNMDKKTAMSVISALTANKTIVHQPPKVDAPNTVQSNQRTVASAPKKPEYVELDQHQQELARLCGVDEKATKRIARKD